jgi:superfamily II RNA helicase
VVFVDFKKPGGCGSSRGGGASHRVLKPDEYMQMAGRAGRRGKDTSGLVLYLPSREPLSPVDVKAMMTGSSATLESKMEFHYEFLLKALEAGTTVSWKIIMTDSYWYCQRLEEIGGLEAKAAALVTQIAATTAIAAATPAISTALDERIALETAFKNAPTASVSTTAKKDAQRACDKWRNTHVGPVWDNAWKARILSTKLTTDHTHILKLIADANASFEEPVLNAIRFLTAAGFLVADAATVPAASLTSAHLTEKGILATELNECHELLAAELYESGLLAAATAADIVAVLATFASDRDEEYVTLPADLNISTIARTALEWIGNKSQTMLRLEDIVAPRCDDGSYWRTSTAWIEPMHRWMLGEELCVLCAEYDLHSGTFIRTVLKMANVMEEWGRLATYKKDVATLDALKDVAAILVRGVVKPDSLYLRL